MTLQDTKRVLDFLHRSGFLVVYFTGGEPTLHPHITEIVGYANELGFITSLTTNGTSSEGTIRRLKEAGLHLLSVSLDHWDDGVCEKIRGVRGIKQKEEEILTCAKEIGLSVYALNFLNPYVIRDGMEVLIRHVNHDLGVPFGFCYPTSCDDNSYRLGGSLSDEELYVNIDGSIKTILEMKKGGSAIANPFLYIEDVLRFNNNEAPNYCCKGGEDVVYIDWRGDVYPCFLKPRLFNILDGNGYRFLKYVRCNECLINCFREPSLFSQALRAPGLAIRELRYSWANTLKLMVP